MNYKRLNSLLIFGLILLIVGCSSVKNETNNNKDGTDNKIEGIDQSNVFTDNDLKTDFDESKSVTINLNDSGCTSSSRDVIIDNHLVTITKAGTYLLSGTLSDGQIKIDATNEDKIQLVFQNVIINSVSSASLYIKQADKVFVTLMKDSENTLTNSSAFIAVDENNIDSVIFSKDDLTFNGEGRLTIRTNNGHGIVSKDDLTITGGTYIINSKKHALVGKDCVKIANGYFELTSGTDGIHSENTEDSTLGYTYIAGGEFKINAQSDGIDSSALLQINEGTFTIKAYAMGIKSTSSILIEGGKFNIYSTDDAVHTNLNIEIINGTFECSTRDDAFHADQTLTIDGGNITVVESYEGLEAENIIVNAGTISIKSSDDGINVSGGNDSSGFGGPSGGKPGMDQFKPSNTATASITINGGIIKVDASGDGLDANGNIYISGGEVYVLGPTDNGNGAIDYDGTAQITGGMVVAVGQSGMAQNFGSSSTQGSIMVNLSTKTNGKIVLYDSNGEVLISFSPEKMYNSVVISCPELTIGKSYRLETGNQSTSVTLTSLIYGSGSSRPGRP